MKSLKYLNGVLTVIAFCLVLITLAVTGLIPTASAKEKSNNTKFATLPVNSDGTVSVDIEEIDGHGVNQAELPVEVSNTVEVENK